MNENEPLATQGTPVSSVEKKDSFGRYLGIGILEARPGYARTRMPLDERHENGVGIAHGGAMFALADIAFAAAANAATNTAVLNIATSVSYLKAGTVGPLEGEAKAINIGHRVSVYEVRVTDGNGALLAVFQITGYHTERPL